MATDADVVRQARWVADQWAEYNGIANQIQGYKAERTQFRTDHPEVDAFLTWQQQQYDMADAAGDPTKVAGLLAGMSPAYADWYRKLNQGERTDPNVLFSDEAYLLFTQGRGVDLRQPKQGERHRCIRAVPRVAADG